MKLLIIGDGEHGKDTVADEIQALSGLSLVSSSFWCLERAIWKRCDGVTLPAYANPEAAYEDRRNHRETWKRLIAEYNTPKDRLVAEILSEHDMYVGLRKRDEFEAAKHHFDEIIWVDAALRLPVEASNELDRSDATIWFDNNGDLTDLKRRTFWLWKSLKTKYGEYGND